METYRNGAAMIAHTAVVAGSMMRDAAGRRTATAVATYTTAATTLASALFLGSNRGKSILPFKLKALPKMSF
jgi:hypothetical protein